MIDYLPWIVSESEHLRGAIASISHGSDPAPLDSLAVPACPDWSAADLAWHFAGVQYFWATMVGDGLSDYRAAPQLARPSDEKLPTLLAEQSERLLTVLAEGPDDEPCWSWHPRGGTRGWVRRRQAHEALIHRVDAEQTAALRQGADGQALTPVDEELAGDGIEEMLAVMLNIDHPPAGPDGVTAAGSFQPSGASVRIQVPERAWDLEFGHFAVPDTDGRMQQLQAVQRAGSTTASPSAVLIGPASEVNLWLWRRLPLTNSTVRGDTSAVTLLSEAADLS